MYPAQDMKETAPLSPTGVLVEGYSMKTGSQGKSIQYRETNKKYLKWGDKETAPNWKEESPEMGMNETETKWNWGKQSFRHRVQNNGSKNAQGAQWELQGTYWEIYQHEKGCRNYQ